jgi:hypothetical protein
VDRPAQLGLPRDVHHPRLAGIGARGDPRGAAENVVAERQHRDAVDLADRAPLGVDEQGALGDDPARALLQEVRAVRLLRDRVIDVVGPDERMAALAGPERGLADQIQHVAQPRGEAALIGDEPAAVLDEPGDPVRREREESFLPAGAADEPSVEQLEVRGARQRVVEVHLDLEQLVEILVEGRQQVVEERAADQDHLDRERDGLGREARAAGHPPFLQRVLDPYRSCLERLLERVPDQRVAQHIDGVQDQVAPVRPVQRPGPDQAEIRHQAAEVRPVLGAPHQVAVGGIRLEHHRRSGEPMAVHQDIDLVAVQEAPGSRHEGQHRLRLGRTAELLGVGHQVLLHLRQISLDVGQPGEFLPELLEHWTDRRRRYLTDQPFVGVPRLVLDLPDPAEGHVHLLLDGRALTLHLLLHRIGKGRVVRWAQRLAVGRGSEAHPGRGAEDREPVGPGDLLQLAHLLLLAPTQVLQDLGLLLLELLALECPGETHPALLGQPAHVLPEPAPAAGGHLERGGPVRIREVVHVAVVGRHRLALGGPGELPLHRRGLAGAGRTEDEEVVAGVAHAHAEGGGGRRALLSDQSVHRRQLSGGAKRQRARVADRAEIGRLESTRHDRATTRASPRQGRAPGRMRPRRRGRVDCRPGTGRKRPDTRPRRRERAGIPPGS